MKHIHGKIFRKMLLFFLVLSVLIIGLSACFLLRIVSRSEYKEIRAANQRAADVAAQSINQCFASATADLSKLYVDPTVVKLHNTGTSLSSREVYCVYECMRKLANVTAGSVATEDYFLFLPDLSCMVSYNMRYAFESNTLGTFVYNPGYESLRTELANATTSGIYAVGEDERSVYIVLLTQDFSKSSMETSYRLAVCAKLNMDYILRILDDAAAVVQTPFALMDADDTILCATDGFSTDTELRVTAPLRGAGHKVVACVSREDLAAHVRSAMLLPIVMLLVGLLLIFATCYSLTWILYKPLRRVLLYAQAPELSLPPPKLSAPHRDELSQIQYALYDARVKIQELSHSVEHYSTLAFPGFFRRLCEGVYHDADFIRAEFARYGITLAYPYFLVHIFKADTQFPSGDSATDVRALINDVLSRYLLSIPDEISFLTVIDPDSVTVLYNLAREHTPDGLKDCCHAILGRLDDELSHANGKPARCICGCSALWMDVTGIVESYREAKKALEQDIFCMESETVFYARNNPVPKPDAYCMTRDDERVITDALRRGDDATAALRMHLIVEDNARAGSSEHIELILTQLLTLPLRLLRECGYCPSNVFGQPDAILFQTLRIPTKLSRRVSEMTEWYERTAAFFRQQSAHFPLSEESLTCFLEENYARDFAVSDAAAAFGMSVSYFSASIKRLTGQTFIENLNGFRVARAVELLREPGGKMSLSEISERVGFQNYRTFARAFSREMNVSPESFRRRMDGL